MKGAAAAPVDDESATRGVFSGSSPSTVPGNIAFLPFPSGFGSLSWLSPPWAPAEPFPLRKLLSDGTVTPREEKKGWDSLS